MAGKYDNTNTFVLFQNDKKGNPKAPDYTGTVNVNGEDFEAAGWKKVSTKDGKTFMSGRLELKKANRGGGGRPSNQHDDDIPF
jgi:uncharacterized protein (DUF736 family)